MSYQGAKDTLPSMVGFEADFIGADDCLWRSNGYLLSDRALDAGERIHAWVIRNSDGRIMKSISFTPSEIKYRDMGNWPAAFLEAINNAPPTEGGSRLLYGGNFENNGALTALPNGSPTSSSFYQMSAVQKASVNRLWYYDNGYRIFTSAPFIANQVIAIQVPDIDLPADESVSVQVRDRSSLHLYETYLFTPERTDGLTAKVWSRALFKHIKESTHYGMLRAGILDNDGVSIIPGDTDNGLWIPQCSDLSVELEFVTWQKCRSLERFQPVPGETIQILIYDRYSSTQLPGSPFRYTITDADGATCMASLATALQTSPLGRFLKLGGQGNQTLSVMGLPVRVVTVGLPSITSAYERALESLNAKPLSLGELHDRYKDGVTLTLKNRWNGHEVDSRTFLPDDNSKITKDAWVRALCDFLSSNFVPQVPFLWFGEADARPTAPNWADANVDGWTLWLPTEAEMVLVAEQSVAMTLQKKAKPQLLSSETSFRRDKLVIEEVLVAGTISLITDGFFRLLNPEKVIIDKLLKWGADDFIETQVKKITAAYANLETGYDISTRLRNDIKLFALLHKIEQKQLPNNIVTNSIFASTLLYTSISALSASRVARDDILSQEIELFDLGLPYGYRVESYATSTEKRKTLRLLKSEDLSESVQLFSILRRCTEHIKNIEKFEKKIDPNRTDDVPPVLIHQAKNEISKENSSYIPQLNKYLRHLNTLKESEYLRMLYEIKSLESTVNTERNEIPEHSKITGAAVTVFTDDLSASSNSPNSSKLIDTLKQFQAIESFSLEKTTRDLINLSPPPYFTLSVELLPEAYELGIRFISHSQELIGSGGISLHIPNGATIPPNFPLARASYISETGIIAAAPTALTINPPITGRAFIPADSLCADYANTLGSEVYDVSGAVENGVDPRTGLFHAHYPIGVIRGLSGKGPEIELNLHYSATRANEGALGDGWAFRFSSYDNRLRRLTLSTGQTLTLTADQIEAARAGKLLRINGITLTDTKGTFDKLTGLTVIYPTGRQEVLAMPVTSDGKEASENYKKTFAKKLDSVKTNLQQWLDESELSSQQTDSINKQIKEIDRLKTDINRTALILVPSLITSPQGATLNLAWTGKEGHIQLNTIKDGSVVLLSATHTAPVAQGQYGSTFTVWPGTLEEYSVTLDINDCLLTKLTRKGKTDAVAAQTVVFGYCGEPVLDRVLNSVAEEDGSLEAVSYASTWKTWNTARSGIIPLSRVARHTLVPGAGQPAISHTWQWQDINNWIQENGSTFSSTQMLDNGDGISGSFTRRTWTLKNNYSVLTETVEETPAYSRTTTRMEYADEVRGNSLTAKYRWATQPVKTTVTTEDLRPATDAASSSEQES
ncbi:hypothetical protein [Pseudomonas poae]|uniref:hypothetical protein n=1 Tax=Pseudomonas poae TaxID=200451 RepID=UPI0015E491EC|nr:hypothetical protein [Pseudomonas poae]